MPNYYSSYKQASSYSQTFNRLKVYCYICQKEDCQLWRYIDKEQAKAKEIYKSKFNNCTKGRFNNCFKEQFKQYITKYKEGDKDLKIKVNNAFKSLILDIKFKFNLEEFAIKKKLELGIIYFTVFKELMPNKATFISTVLANKAFSHLLILKDITKPILTTNPFIYTLNIFSF